MTNSFLTMAGAAAPLAAWFCNTDLKTGYVISPYRFLLATILNSLSKITKDLWIPREGEFESLESDFLGYVSLLPTHNHLVISNCCFSEQQYRSSVSQANIR